MERYDRLFQRMKLAVLHLVHQKKGATATLVQHRWNVWFRRRPSVW